MHAFDWYFHSRNFLLRRLWWQAGYPPPAAHKAAASPVGPLQNSRLFLQPTQINQSSNLPDLNFLVN